jgi:hypothetical protein
MDVAIHQAGHAVMACLLGIPFSALTSKGINRYDEWPIWAVPNPGPNFQVERARQFVEREMCVALAGPTAQAINCNWKTYTRARGTNDEAYAMEITWGFGADDTERHGWVDRVSATTYVILDHPSVWNTVLAVAQRLRQSTSLSYPLVREIARERLKLAAQTDERYSDEESRWCRVEDARLLAAGQPACPKNTHNTISLGQVLAELPVAA